MAVFLRHTFRYVVESFDGPDPIRRLLGVMSNGAYGVSLFFVLSGFLITYLLLDETKRNGAIRIPAFYMRRILRIWPLYYAVLLIGLVMYPLVRSVLGMSNPFAHEWEWYVLFLSNFDVMNAHHRGLSGSTLMMVAITWSVAIEEQFYLVWPWLVRWARAHRAILFGGIVVVSTFFRSRYANDDATLHFHTLAAVGDLAIGALAAELAYVRPNVIRRLTSLRGPRLVFAYVSMLVLLMYQDSLFGPAVGRCVQTACFAYVILDQCYGTETWSKLSRLPLLTVLGRYTYGLYLLHPVAITFVDIGIRRIFPQLGDTKSAWLLFALAFPLSLVLAIGSYHFFEKRFLDLKQRFA
jgi:peptidoglycan/LPS O-acetylase OafA/YrhL